MEQDPPPFHARLWIWIVYSLVIVYGTISIGTDMPISLSGLACMPVVLGGLLIARGLVLAVLHVPLDLFVGKRKVLSGVPAWVVPPAATLGLLVLNEAGIVSYSYVSYTYDQHLDHKFVTDHTEPGGRSQRMVRNDGTTYVAFGGTAKADEESGKARRFQAGDRPPAGITVTPKKGCSVTDGFRATFPSLDQLGCAYAGQITVRASNPSVLGVLRASAEVDVTIEFDILFWLPNGADTAVRGKSTIRSEGRMVGFSSKRAFLFGFGGQIGKPFGDSLMDTARSSLEKLRD